MNRDELARAVRAWLETTSGAREAADWLLDRAESCGQIPKRLTVDASVPWQDALAAFLSARFVRLTGQGRKFTVHFDRWEQQHFEESGVLLPILAEVCGRMLVNRSQQRQQREWQIREFLKRYAYDGGLPGHVARRELDRLKVHQGRFWSRSRRSSQAETESELGRYFDLLRYVEALRKDFSRIERVVHVSRAVAGDTHWLRPGNRVWRDLARDILDFDADMMARLEDLASREARARALAETGIVENLTSVVVMVYGHFGLHRGNAIWRWPDEAAHQRLPVWLTAVHLRGSRLLSNAPVELIITVENETSFLDLVEQHADDASVVLVYTEGQANRAVTGLLCRLSDAFPTAEFQHQGDLDVAGIRILASLAERTGLRIQPSNMDAETHQRFVNCGIRLTEDEHSDVLRELKAGKLPSRDLLERIAATRMRIEQESITAEVGRSSSV
jgi:hypothetical protein